MGKTIIDILTATAIVVFIVDLSGIVDTIKGWLGRKLGGKVGRIRPFDCSLCMTFWTGLVVLLCEGAFSLPMVAFVCLCAFLTPVIKGLLVLVSDLMITLINKINDKL